MLGIDDALPVVGEPGHKGSDLQHVGAGHRF
jgi:hypothetical protein